MESIQLLISKISQSHTNKNLTSFLTPNELNLLTDYFNSLEVCSPELAAKIDQICVVLNALHTESTPLSDAFKNQANSDIEHYKCIQALFRLCEGSQYKHMVAPLLAKLIHKLPDTQECILSYPDKDHLLKVLLAGIEKKRKLSQREKYEQLVLLSKLLSQPVTIDTLTLQSLTVLSLALDESEAVRSESRSCLLQIARYQMPQLKLQIKKLVPNLKASLDAICKLDYESEMAESVRGDDDIAQRENFNEIFSDELVIYGVIPIELVEQLQHETNLGGLDWKRKEQICEQIQFIIETLNNNKLQVLAKYADSFLKFIIQAMIHDEALKVVRIGIRLIWFVITNVDKLSFQTNVVYLIQNLLEMFNETLGGFSVIHKEVQQLLLTLSSKISLKLILISIIQQLPQLLQTGKGPALKTFIILALTQGKGSGEFNTVYSEDRTFFLSQIKSLVDLIQKSNQPFLRNLAVEALIVLAKCNRFFRSENTEVLEALQECTDDQIFYNIFCDRLELKDEAFLVMTERRNGQSVELRLPYLDKLEMQAIAQKQRVTQAERVQGQSGEYQQHIVLLKEKQIPEVQLTPAQMAEKLSLFKRRQQRKQLVPLPNINKNLDLNQSFEDVNKKSSVINRKKYTFGLIDDGQNSITKVDDDSRNLVFPNEKRQGLSPFKSRQILGRKSTINELDAISVVQASPMVNKKQSPRSQAQRSVAAMSSLQDQSEFEQNLQKAEREEVKTGNRSPGLKKQPSSKKYSAHSQRPPKPNTVVSEESVAFYDKKFSIQTNSREVESAEIAKTELQRLNTPLDFKNQPLPLRQIQERVQGEELPEVNRPRQQNKNSGFDPQLKVGSVSLEGNSAPNYQLLPSSMSTDQLELGSPPRRKQNTQRQKAEQKQAEILQVQQQIEEAKRNIAEVQQSLLKKLSNKSQKNSNQTASRQQQLKSGKGSTVNYSEQESQGRVNDLNLSSESIVLSPQKVIRSNSKLLSTNKLGLTLQRSVTDLEMESSKVQPLDNPTQSFNQMTKNFKSDNWEKHYEAIQTLRSFIQHHPEQIQSSQLKSIVEFSDSLRSGLAKLALKTLSEYIQVFDLQDKEVQDAQKLLLRKVSDTTDFIRTNAYDCLRTLTLKYDKTSVNNFLILLNSGFYSTTGSQANQSSQSSRLAIIKCLTDLNKKGFASQESITILKVLLSDKDVEVRQEARNAVVALAQGNSQAEELVLKWMPVGEQQTLSLEIIRNGLSDFISPRKLRKQVSQKQ